MIAVVNWAVARLGYGLMLCLVKGCKVHWSPYIASERGLGINCSPQAAGRSCLCYCIQLLTCHGLYVVDCCFLQHVIQFARAKGLKTINVIRDRWDVYGAWTQM